MYKQDLDMIRVRQMKARHITNGDLDPSLPTNTRLFLLSAKDDVLALLKYVDRLEDRVTDMAEPLSVQ